jgi:hypothetical protein
MNTQTLVESHPLVYADQRKKKVFVMTDDRSKTFEPEELIFEDVAGNTMAVPTFIQGYMTVLDVSQMKAGGHFLRFINNAGKSIKVILF